MNKIKPINKFLTFNGVLNLNRKKRVGLRVRLRIGIIQKIFIALIIVSSLNNLSCSVYETFVNISRLKFKLGDVNNFTLSGVNLTNKRKIEDFTSIEILKLSSSFASGKLPVSFVLNVNAKNPNDGKGGYKKTNATIKSFPWRLSIDDKETIAGNIGNPVTVPGTGEETIIPLTLELDLVRFFKDKGYEQIINLALNIGGNSGSASRLALFTKPTVTSSFGDITYPEEIKIVDFQYTN
jgi:hypothetical protein